jgi:peptide-methionine (S)-S-oxide reductase
MHTFVLAGGCFWCLDAVYRTLRGVTDVVSGYTGGVTKNPDYDAVGTGMTGHAEAVAVTFDPEVIPDSVILDVFFSLHDPRQLNRQGNDRGTQYRSAMFYTDDAQKKEFEGALESASGYWDGGLVTTLEPLGTWYTAEDYHQDFFAKNPGQGYCMAIAVPKVNKIRQSFADYVLVS